MSRFFILTRIIVKKLYGCRLFQLIQASLSTKFLGASKNLGVAMFKGGGITSLINFKNC